MTKGPSLCDFMRKQRLAKGLSQRQLANAAGLSSSYVNKLEAGEVDPSFRAFSQLAVELGLNSREVFHLVRQEASHG